MYEAIELSSSVITVLQLTAATISTCYNYAVSKEKEKVIAEVRALQQVLEDVHELVEDEEEKKGYRLPGLTEVLNRPDGLPACRSELESLKAKLDVNDGNSDQIQFEMPPWPLEDDEVSKTLESLRRCQDFLGLTLSVDQTRLMLSVDEGRQGAGHRRQHENVYTWLGAPDHRENHTIAWRNRQEATGTWFTQGEQFKDWGRRPNSFLWLHGNSGSGKTHLCSSIVEEISRHCKSDPSLAIAYFYFDIHTTDTRPYAVLRSLIEQLSFQCPTTPDVLLRLFSRNADGRRSPTPSTLLRTIKSIIETFQNVYLIFDALDECPSRNDVFSFLHTMQSWRLGTLHLLATSRPEPDIEQSLSSVVSHDIRMDESLVDGDIQIYVTKLLEDDLKFRMCSAADIDMIKATLFKDAHGRFRWVACQLNTLRRCRSPAALEKSLKSLPRTLYESYDKILAEIDKEEDRADTLRLLKWIAFSKRKLSLDEAVDVLSIYPETKDEALFDIRRRLRDPRYVLTVCSSLISIAGSDVVIPDDRTRSDYDFSHVPPDSKLRLAHPTVREYLVSEYMSNGIDRVTYYHFSKTSADIYIALSCLIYLLEFQQQGSVNSETNNKTHPLYAYVTQHWTYHAHSDADGNSEPLHGMIMDLLQLGHPVYSNWLAFCDPDEPFDWPRVGANCAPLYYTSSAGLFRASKSLLDNGSDVNAQGGKYGNALQAASVNGHYKVVQLLLERGAQVNMQGGYYQTALQGASANGHLGIVNVLVGRWADVNAQGGEYGCALRAALNYPHVEIVGFLFGHGAIISEQDPLESRAILALRHPLDDSDPDSLPVRRRRGPKDSDVNDLYVASLDGDERTVRSLLEQGMDVNAKGGMDNTALQAASARGRLKIVQILLDHGADVNIQGGHYGNALQAATMEGNIPVVRLLLERGANVNALGGFQGTALEAASSTGIFELVQLLLEHGADVNLHQGEHGGALHEAAFQGAEDVIHLLLDHGADVNAPGGDEGCALEIATAEGNAEAVQALLERGADVNRKGYEYGCILQEASYSGHERIVRMLLNHGAHVNAAGGSHGSALIAAAEGGDVDILLLLLQNGADVNLFHGEESSSGFTNALQAAAARGHRLIVRLLLAHGANARADGVYESAMRAALEKRHDEIVTLLQHAAIGWPPNHITVGIQFGI